MSVTERKSANEAPAFVRKADTTPGAAAAEPWSVRMRNVGKRYRLGEVNAANDNFREDLVNWFKSLGKGDFLRQTRPNEFWALKDIDVEMKRGDTVGIIGRNGAGKSTLLKILSRITAPTTGEIEYRGRLASLLEVGTGFHRELTGRENIYLNGAILGMSRAEIEREFDAIVDFAGVDKFLGTPVKFYSSGMKVRLAFAVAAHLRTDILVIDEVLAVGDAEFQKKCLGKMQDVAGDGRTVLFVSHNMTAVASLCRYGIVLSKGEMLRNMCSAQEAVSEYLSFGIDPGKAFEKEISKEKDATITHISVRGADGNTTPPFSLEQPVIARIGIYSKVTFEQLLLTVYLRNKDGVVVVFSDFIEGSQIDTNFDGHGFFEMEIPGGILQEGVYSVTAGIRPRLGGSIIDVEPDACNFEWVATGGDKEKRNKGVVRIPLKWSVEKGKSESD